MDRVENNTLEEIRALFGAPGTVAILGHVSPDGDCVSSCLALKHFLWAKYQKEADIYMEAYQEDYRILPGCDSIRVTPGSGAYDTVFTLDCADRGRVGAAGDVLERAGRIVCIDHHISNPGFGDYNYVLGDMSSCCEVLYQLFGEENLNCDIAECLYTGIAHDTGIFQYSNVSPMTLARAAKLIGFGFDFPDIIQKTYFENSFEKCRAWGYAASKAQLFMDGWGIWTSMNLQEMEQYGVKPTELEGVINEIRNAKGTDVAVFLYETEPGTYKASFRSKGGTNVSQVAVAYGGGGHLRASGCTFVGREPEEIMEDLVAEIEKAEMKV